MSDQGAPAAYRGYRLQALYALSRILSVDENQTAEFHLEGSEDLDIERSGKIIETIQVKSYTSLVLSDLSPGKKDSFFRRVLNKAQSSTPPKILLVNFGLIGEEMHLAWQGDKKHREGISTKLKTFGYDEKEINRIFEKVELVELQEGNVFNELTLKLRELLVGVDSANAFDLLHYWLYVKSESRGRVNRQDLIDKIQNVGQFVSERYHHHKEWFATIHPIEDFAVEAGKIPELREEFNAGVSARYEHILADLDFRRESKLQEVSEAFEESNVVILHAASGQGKSTLAFRYLHDMYPSLWRFSVQLIENRQHASSIAFALAGHARALQSPMIILIDVSPRDTEWPELVKQLSNNQYIQILVVIREEDFHRANISNAFDYVSVDLLFDEKEARLVYTRVSKAGYPLAQLDFEDAWRIFGGDGPLMEFVYLLTQTRTLRQRLEEQIKRIRMEIREKQLSADELALLRLVSVATAYDARVRLRDLIGSLNLPDPGQTLELLEKEYLLRVTPDSQYIIGLHPVRSRILVEILTDPIIAPWASLVQKVTQLIPEEDWELFFLQAFLDRETEFKDIIAIITDIFPMTPVGLVGMLRCLLWSGIKGYIEENWGVTERARELFGQGWYFILDFNFAGEEALTMDEWWRELGTLIPKDKQEQIAKNRQNQTPKEHAFVNASKWLAQQKGPIQLPVSDKDWRSFAEVLYWASRWGISKQFEEALNDESLLSALRSVPLLELSEFSMGFFLSNQKRQMKWVKDNRAEIEERLSKELRIMALTQSEETLIIHFLTYPEESLSVTESEQTQKTLHDETIDRIQIVRQLFPQYSKYGSQGYGHQIPSLGNLPDQTTKTGIPAKSLPPSWPIRLNSVTSGLVQYKYRLDSWDEYIKQVLERRSLLIDCIRDASDGIVNYIRRDKPFNLLKIDAIASGKWDTCKELVNNLPMLPKQAVDGWGLSQPENQSKNNSSFLGSEKYQSIFIADKPYKPYLDSERDYLSSMAGFMETAPDIMVINYKAGKLPEDSPQKQAMLQQLAEKKIRTNVVRISVYDVEKAKESLASYQSNFRLLFGNRVNSDELSSLESRETKSVSLLRILWNYYAKFPRTAIGDPIKAIPARVEAVVQGFYINYDRALENISNESVRARRIDTRLCWKDSPTIWLHLDVDEPTSFFNALDALIFALRNTLGVIDIIDLQHKLIEEIAKYTVIIPTIKGKMINSQIWPLITTFTITVDEPFEKKVWAYVPAELPRSVRDDLNISAWDSEAITSANELSDSVKKLAFLLNFVSQIKRMPEPTDAGGKYLEEFMKRRSSEMSELIQEFIDRSTEVIGEFNKITKGKQSLRSYLSSAVALLAELYNQVIPVRDAEGQIRLDLDAVADYAEKVQKARISIEAVKLYLIADTLEIRP